MRLLRPGWIFVAVAATGLLAMARAQQYYGNIYRGWDAQFYYALAHSLVFDRDLDITDDLALTPYPGPFDRDGDGSWESAPRRPDGSIPTKYPLGMSLVEAPLVAIGSLARTATGALGMVVPGAAGYSAIELWCVAIGLLLLLAYGLATLYRLLAGEYGGPAAALGVFGCWMGTSLFYYSVVEPYMAHAVSLVLLVMVMKGTHDLSAAGPANRRLAMLGLGLAMLFLVRPQQAMVAAFLLPALSGLIRSRPMAEWAPGAAVGAAACAIAILAQIGMNSRQFGVATISGYSVGGEGFAWMAPRLDIVLTGGSRGLLVFSPVVLLAVLGFVLYPRSVPGYAWPQVWNAIAQVYLIASWSSPGQGQSFGPRMLSDNAGVAAVGLAVLLQRSPARWRWIVGFAAVAAVCWTTLLLGRYIRFGER
jgi:hypothetical protein